MSSSGHNWAKWIWMINGSQWVSEEDTRIKKYEKLKICAGETKYKTSKI